LDVTGELLTKSKRGGILEMGSTDLDDGLELGPLDLHSVSKLVKSREKGRVELGDGGDVHGGGEAIGLNKRGRQEGRKKREGGRRKC
jgi:hypothetical protein